MRKLGFAIAAAVMITGGAAHAADLGRAPVVKAPVVAPVPFSWTGFYVGAHIGGAWADSATSNVAPFGGFDEGLATTYGLSPSGWLAGGQLGFNWQAGNIVFGVEADLGHLDLNEQISITATPPDDFARVDFGWYGTLTGRLGWAWDRALIYVKGGGAWARIVNEAGDLDGGVPDPTDFTSISKTHFGWALGGGIEWAFAPNWSVKAEYLYMDFGSERTTNIDGDFFDHENEVHTVKLGVNYRFGWGGPVVARY